MSESNFIRKDTAGKLYIKDRDDREYLLSTQVLKEDNFAVKRPTTKKYSSKFKLATVRRLSNLTLEEANADLEREQRRLSEIALSTGQPIPYPYIKPLSSDDLSQVYGVFVDEDINGKQSPVFIFSSPSNLINVYVTNNGDDINSWSIHLSYIVNITKNPNDTKTVIWRLLTIDNEINGNSGLYFLDSTQLPDCFSYNFNPLNLNYLGGGCFTAMSVDPNKRVPIIAVARLGDNNYIQVGRSFVANGVTLALCIVSYSFTPDYSFTWCRGKLDIHTVSKSASSTYTNKEGILYLDKQFNYSLVLTERPNLNDDNQTISNVHKTEYSTGNSTYIGTTNYRICSTFQCPDFGTDAARTSLMSYTQSTNVIRDKNIDINNTLSVNKTRNHLKPYLPIIANSNNASMYLRLNMGEASGSINHGFETKTTIGQRSYGYEHYYKLWWTYGKVINFYPIGDTHRYLNQRTSSSFAGVAAGSMFDFGDLIFAPGTPNAVETTWGAPFNPPSGYFSYYFGTLTFKIDYLNPPIFGHDSIYYYNINPSNIAAGDLDNNYEDNSAETLQLNTLKYIYNEMNAGLGGRGIDSLNIGNVLIAQSEPNTLLMREPTSEQQLFLSQNPEYFPNVFWDNINVNY